MTSTAASPDLPRGARRARLAAAHVALIVACFVQAPGLTSADTKLDLVVDPLRFLGRALSLWEPQGAFGQLQNQAYGYLFPMGPFFALGSALGVPGWVVQRLWWALLLVLAFDGAVLLARRLGIGTDGTRIIAGFAFALSPRAMTELGGISAELWPTALAPWVLLPLVRVPPGRERHAAARSALAVALCGGVNAVAVGAVLPLPALWLLTRPRGPARRRLAAWWSGLVLAAVAWWLLPLLILGRYSPPFLDWIESAAVTTSVATPAAALRGLTHWVPFADPAVWPAGADLATSGALLLLLWLPVMLGVAGLLTRSLPHRRYLVLGVLVGVALLTLGHVGPAMPPWAGAVRTFLDAAGAPLRNTHKFDVVVRLPLALALAHAVATVRLPALPGVPWSRFTVRVLAVCGVVAAATPVLGGAAASGGTFTRIPAYWYDAAAWLRDHDDGGRTLVVPGSAFATSVWGDPRDEPLQALASTPWAVRNVVPLSSAGNIRMLTAVEQQLASGRPTPGLAEYLRRAGVTRLLVRSDLAGVPTSAPRPLSVLSTLGGSPGLRPVASFGPVSGQRSFGDAVVDSGLDVLVPALQVWDVAGSGGSRAELMDARDAVRVAGGPEDLLTLADDHLLGGRPVVLDGDPQAGALAAAPLVATDGPQRREARFSAVRDVYSAPLTSDEPWRQERRVHDWLPFQQPQVVATYVGIAAVRASSDVGASGSAWSAVDGDPATAWTSNPYVPGTPWLQVDLAGRTVPPATLQLQLADGARVPSVEVVTEQGRRRTPLAPPGDIPQTVGVPSGPTAWIRLEFGDVAPSLVPRPVAVRELRLPGIPVARPLRLPATAADAGVVALHAARAGSDGCAYLGGRPLCSPSLDVPGEDPAIDRVLPLRTPAAYSVAGTVRPAAGPALDRLLQPLGSALVATASSRRSGEPAERPQAAVDRDLGTAWVAAVDDPAPTLTLAWKPRRSVSSLQFQTDAALASSRAARITVSSGSVTRTVRVGADGWARFAPLTGTRLKITVVELVRRRSVDPVRGIVDLPFGVSEVVVPALDDLRRGPDLAASTGAPCGFGPEVTLGDRAIRTRVQGTVGDVLRRRPMRLLPCTRSGTPVAAGLARVRMAPTRAWLPDGLLLRRAGAPATATADGPASEPLTPAGWDAERRVLPIGASARERVLVVHENANPGWSAHLGGVRLTPVRLDGWQQAWIVPAGAAGSVVLTFDPGTPYRAALLAGAALLALVVLAALVPGRARRRARPSVPVPAGTASAVPAALGAGVLVLAGGPVAAAWVALLAIATWRLRPGRRTDLARAVAAATALAAIAAAAASSPRGEGLAGWVATTAVWGLLAAVAVGAVVGAGRSDGALGRPRAADETAQAPLSGPLDEVPRPGGGKRAEERRRREHRHEVPLEDGHVEELVQRGERDHVPEEEPVADRAGPDQRR